MNAKVKIGIVIAQVVTVALLSVLSFVLPVKTYTIDGSRVQYEYSVQETQVFMASTEGLGRGSYDVIFHYSSLTGNNTYEFVDDGSVCSQIHYDRNLNLMAESDVQRAHLYLTAPCSHFQLMFNVYGGEYLEIEKVEFIQNHSDLRVCAITLGLFFIVANLIGLWYAKTKDKWIFAAVLIGLIAALPVFTGYLTGGHDLTFHLYRIEGIKDALLSGQFPARVAPTPFYGYGNANSQYYPELFLYVPALMRIAGFSVQAVFLMLLFTIHLGSALISYASFDYLFKEKKKAILISAFYTLAFYRLEVVHYRYAIGEALAMMFLPLFIAAFMRLTEEGKKDFKARRRNVTLLVVTFTCILQSHLLSCLMLVFVGLVLLATYFKRIIKNRTWIDLLIAMVITVLLNLWFLLPLKQAMGLDYYMRAETNADIGENALFVSQLFFPTGQFDGVTEDIVYGIRGEMPLSLGLSCAVVFVILLVFVPLIWKKRKEEKSAKMFFLCLALTVLYMFMCTNLFPWYLVREGGKIFAKLFGVIQFPWRYLSLATLFEGLALGYGLNCLKKEKWVPALSLLTAAVILIGALFTAQNLITSDTPRRVYDEQMRNRRYITKDYLNINTDIYNIPSTDFLLEQPYLLSVSRYGSNLDAQVTNDTVCAQVVSVPLFLFPGYTAWDDAGSRFELQRGINEVIGIVVPSGYSGTIHVGVKEKPDWLVADGLSLVTLFGCVLLWILRLPVKSLNAGTDGNTETDGDNHLDGIGGNEGNNAGE